MQEKWDEKKLTIAKHFQFKFIFKIRWNTLISIRLSLIRAALLTTDRCKSDHSSKEEGGWMAIN